MEKHECRDWSVVPIHQWMPCPAVAWKNSEGCKSCSEVLHRGFHRGAALVAVTTRRLRWVDCMEPGQLFPSEPDRTKVWGWLFLIRVQVPGACMNDVDDCRIRAVSDRCRPRVGETMGRNPSAGGNWRAACVLSKSLLINTRLSNTRRLPPEMCLFPQLLSQ